MNSILSVVIISYNQAKYIKETLEGVVKQETSFPFEVIIGDDASTDGTQKIIEDFAKKHTEIRFKLNLRDKNVGAINNFIETISNCESKYIAFCEGDDYWTDPLKLQKQIDFLEDNNDFSICSHRVKIYNEKTKTFSDSHDKEHFRKVVRLADLLKKNTLITLSTVFRNNFGDIHWLEKSKIGDWPLFIHVLNNNKRSKAIILEEEMGVYRMHDDSMFGTKPLLYQYELIIQSLELLRKHVVLSKENSRILKNNLFKKKYFYYKKKQKRNVIQKVLYKSKLLFEMF